VTAAVCCCHCYQHLRHFSCSLLNTGRCQHRQCRQAGVASMLPCQHIACVSGRVTWRFVCCSSKASRRAWTDSAGTLAQDNTSWQGHIVQRSHPPTCSAVKARHVTCKGEQCRSLVSCMCTCFLWLTNGRVNLTSTCWQHPQLQRHMWWSKAMCALCEDTVCHVCV
jgi:hypothetical protein